MSTTIESTSATASNKRLMQAIFAELAQGNGRPFREAMADDFCWRIAGQASWSREWKGKQAVIEGLLKPLYERFATTYTNRADDFIAEGDKVVVQCRGDVMTKSGHRYDNHYCMVFRLRDGRLRELVEYMDTELAARALGAP
jgi:ketosteroid isomerase-like protein